MKVAVLGAAGGIGQALALFGEYPSRVSFIGRRKLCKTA